MNPRLYLEGIEAGRVLAGRGQSVKGIQFSVRELRRELPDQVGLSREIYGKVIQPALIAVSEASPGFRYNVRHERDRSLCDLALDVPFWPSGLHRRGQLSIAARAAAVSLLEYDGVQCRGLRGQDGILEVDDVTSKEGLLSLITHLTILVEEGLDLDTKRRAFRAGERYRAREVARPV